jgi:hypothetical protein
MKNSNDYSRFDNIKDSDDDEDPNEVDGKLTGERAGASLHGTRKEVKRLDDLNHKWDDKNLSPDGVPTFESGFWGTSDAAKAQCEAAKAARAKGATPMQAAEAAARIAPSPDPFPHFPGNRT